MNESVKNEDGKWMQWIHWCEWWTKRIIEWKEWTEMITSKSLETLVVSAVLSERFSSVLSTNDSPSISTVFFLSTSAASSALQINVFSKKNFTNFTHFINNLFPNFTQCDLMLTYSMFNSLYGHWRRSTSKVWDLELFAKVRVTVPPLFFTYLLTSNFAFPMSLLLFVLMMS